MKLALVGLGHVAKFQIQALMQSQGIELVDVCDSDSTKKSTLHELLGEGPINAQSQLINFYTQLDDLLAHSSADIFLISTPNNTHWPIAKTVLKAGKAVIIEKPICQDVQELSEIKVWLDKDDTLKKRLWIAFHAKFAPDLLAWKDYATEHQEKLGALVGFDSGFFDPYIEEGQVNAHAARSLGGSWFDSGINALSVVASVLNIHDVSIITAHHTKLDGFDCEQLGSVVRFEFPIVDQESAGLGFGSIETNWCLGLNQKTTRLFYQHVNVLLHHSDESVYLTQNGKTRLLFNLQKESPRLVNHYSALFSDLLSRFANGDNLIAEGIQAHELLFNAANYQIKV